MKRNSPINFLLGIAGIMTGSVIILELGHRVVENITATWTETHTTVVVIFFCSVVAFIFAGFVGNGGSRGARTSNGGDYEVLSPDRQLSGNGGQLLLPEHSSYSPVTMSVPQYNDNFFGEDVDL